MDVGSGHSVGFDELMIGPRRSVTVGVAMRVIVAAMSRRRDVMVGAERAIDDERERRHDRKGGRDTSAHRLGETNHPCT